MDREVLVSIKGLQFMEGEHQEQVETINSGLYYQKGDTHYVLFDEVVEGYPKPIKNMIKFSDGACMVNKKGTVNVNMLFEENKKNLSNYVTPFGSILIGIDTESVDVMQNEEQMDVRIKYTLEANYEHLADCDLEISVRERERGISLI